MVGEDDDLVPLEVEGFLPTARDERFLQAFLDRVSIATRSRSKQRQQNTTQVDQPLDPRHVGRARPFLGATYRFRLEAARSKGSCAPRRGRGSELHPFEVAAGGT